MDYQETKHRNNNLHFRNGETAVKGRLSPTALLLNKNQLGNVLNFPSAWEFQKLQLSCVPDYSNDLSVVKNSVARYTVL